MQRLKPKYHQLALLAALLFAAIGVMIFIAKSSHPLLPAFKHEYAKAQGDTIDIGIELNPTIYMVRGDSIWGKDYEIMKQLAARHSLPVKFHPFVPLSHAMDYLDRGLYDLVIASMPLTASLNERFLMTDPVYLDREMLVQLRDSTGHAPIRSASELAKDTVWIPDQSPIASRINNLAAEIGDTIYLESHPDYTAEHLLLLVANGKIKQAVINERIAREMSAQYPQIDVDTPVSFTQFQSWAVSPNNRVLRDSLNSWLADMASHKHR